MRWGGEQIVYEGELFRRVRLWGLQEEPDNSFCGNIRLCSGDPPVYSGLYLAFYEVKKFDQDFPSVRDSNLGV